MRTRTRWLLPALPFALAAASLACGHGASTHPPLQPGARAAIPVGDPSAITTPRDLPPTPGIQRVTVKLTRSPSGGVKVLEFLSPDLDDAEKAELRQAIERGEARPEFEPERPVSTWTTTVIRHR